MKRFFGATAAIALLSVGAMGQDERAAQAKAQLEQALMQAKFVGAGGGVMGRTVKGAPYSGQEITETNQLLGDGTRIHNETKAMVYRDSEGRVRRDVGDNVTIWDPVANVTYRFDSKAMTAVKSEMAPLTFIREARAGGVGAGGGRGVGVGGGVAAGGSGSATFTSKDGAVTVIKDGQTSTVHLPGGGEWVSEDGKTRATVKQVTASGSGSGSATVVTGDGNASFSVKDFVITITQDGKTTTMPMPAGGQWTSADGKVRLSSADGESKGFVMSRNAGKSEALGEQVIEGVKVVGTRQTSTIEAGAIGNDRPLTTVSERWYSQELQTEVMTRRSDPRTGESTFRLAAIDRSEPLAHLFQVPAGYTVTERK